MASRRPEFVKKKEIMSDFYSFVQNGNKLNSCLDNLFFIYFWYIIYIFKGHK